MINLWVDDLREAPPGFIAVKTVGQAVKLLNTLC